MAERRDQQIIPLKSNHKADQTDKNNSFRAQRHINNLGSVYKFKTAELEMRTGKFYSILA